MNTQKQNDALKADEQKAQMVLEDKLNFYECAMHFFSQHDLLQIVEVLERIDTPDKQTQSTIKALKGLWVRHNFHKQDLNIKDQKAA